MSAQLLIQRRFWPFFWVSFLTSFNDNIFKQALIVAVTKQGLTLAGFDSETINYLAPAALILPFVLLSGTAGQISTRFSKAQTIRGVKLIEIPIIIAGALGLVWGNTAVMLGALVLTGLQSTFFGPAKYSYLPEVIEEEQLVGANGLIEMGTFLSVLLGGMTGGGLVLMSNGPQLILVTCAVVAVVGFGISYLIPVTPPANSKLRLDWDPIRPNLPIIRSTMANEPVYLSILGLSWFWFYGACFLALLPPYVNSLLHADPSVIVYFTALFSIGVAVGSVMCEMLSKGRLELGLVPFGSLGMSLFAFDLCVVGAPSLPEGLVWYEVPQTWSGIRISVDFMALAVFSGFFTVPLYTLIQQRTTNQERAGVVAGNNIINSFFILLSSVVLIAFRSVGLTIPIIYGVVALMNLAVSFYIYQLLPEFMLRFCAWLLSLVIYRVEVKDREYFPKDGACLVVSNHVTFVDFLFLSVSNPRPMRFVMFHSFYRFPVLRWLFRDAKVIPIASRKEDPELVDQAYDAMVKALEDGETLCIFPEGMLTRDGRMCPFRPGFQKVLKRAPVPVIPVALVGLWGSFFSRSGRWFDLRPGLRRKVEVVVGAPIDGANADAQTLAQAVAHLGAFEPGEIATESNRPDSFKRSFWGGPN